MRSSRSVSAAVGDGGDGGDRNGGGDAGLDGKDIHAAGEAADLPRPTGLGTAGPVRGSMSLTLVSLASSCWSCWSCWS